MQDDTKEYRIYKSQKNYEQIVTDAEAFQGVPVANHEAFQLMGVLFGNNIISPRQLPVLKDQWLHPRYPEFQPRTMWSFYNNCTESLKSSPPISVMEKHIKLHKTIRQIAN